MTSANGPAPLSGTQWTIRAGGHEAVVVEVGGGLRTYRVDGEDCVDGFTEADLCPGCAGQVLAPWPNRIRDGRYTFAGQARQVALTEPERHNALHGLVSWVNWHPVERREDAVVLECAMPAQIGYPWPLLLRTEWSVSGAGLRATHTVVNTGREDCPFGLAVHPYLMIPGVPVDDLELLLPARSRLLVDGRLLPIGAAKVAGTDLDYTAGRRIGHARLDTAFGDLDPGPDGLVTARITAPDGRAVEVWGDERFRWLQVYTGDSLIGDRIRRAVAVEPMTCPPDAFRSGRDVVVLAPGGSWQGTWGIRPAGRR
ncbi:aldose 1-epimerase family protein [Rhizomonospora bruguierae]|uniref:aldose 1-epimerase family protein n=1 Tax=Rhizomonospora bruguierae TaxID=1581705 RepID=UPI001BCF8CE2|nr:aldose 1-epimerase family protein [Micromonospora sp. NBRC 107566]